MNNEYDKKTLKFLEDYRDLIVTAALNGHGEIVLNSVKEVYMVGQMDIKEKIRLFLDKD